MGNTLQTLMVVLLPCLLNSSIMVVSCFPRGSHYLEAISDRGPVLLQSGPGGCQTGAVMTSKHFVTCEEKLCLSCDHMWKVSVRTVAAHMVWCKCSFVDMAP